jgi:YgiT-type zinc finger domain-containing protein
VERGFVEEEIMRCLICKSGSTEPGTTTVTLERNGLIMVIKGVPAQVCENCGEAYVDEKVASELLTSAEAAAKSGAKVEIRDYVTA